VIVTNITQSTIITEDLKIADSPIDKLLGLLKKPNTTSLLLKTRFGIHTLFFKKPIDIIVLDSDFTIRKLGTVKPNRLFFYNPKYQHIIELPQGTIKKSKTEIGDKARI